MPSALETSSGLLHNLIEAQVERTPDATAVVFDGEALTYRELDRRANQLARHLRRCGVGPDVVVGVCLERSLDMVVAVLGILKAGGAYLPIDPAYPQDRRMFMLDDSATAVVVARAPFLDTVASATGRIHLDIGSPSVAAESTARPHDICVDENLAYVIYTSGSTGRPKGVMVPHRAVSNYILWAARTYGLDSSSTAPLHTPLGFDLTVTSLFPALVTGAMIRIVPESGGIEGLVRTLRSTDGFSSIKITPAHLQMLNELQPPSDRQGRADVIVIGGETLTAETLAPWRAASPGTRLINEYGPTEATVGCCVYELQSASPATGPIPIGRPIDGADIYVLDSSLEPVGTGVVGELYIGGVGLARGYHSRPDLTSERFLPDPFAAVSGRRMYRSGDLGRRRPDGVLEFLGRGDDQVKVRGYRIELGEIDAMLAQHPSVSNAVTVAHTDHAGGKYLTAYIVFRGETAAAIAELRAFLGERLPHYMVPSAFIFLDALPLTSNGKIDRKRLPAADDLRRRDDVLIAPRTPTEAILVKTWSEILGLAAVGIDDNFFEVGGNSIKAAQVVGRVRTVIGAELRLVDVFRCPTIALLAAAIDARSTSGGAATGDSIVPCPGMTTAPLAFAQERVWFLEQLDPSCRAYRFHATIQLDGHIDVGALQRALTEIVRRHEIFRTTFPSIDGQPRQAIHAPYSVDLPLLDLKHLQPGEAEAELRQLVADELRTDFDVQSLPLIRWRLVRLGHRKYCLVHSEHHLVHDGWSFNVFFDELLELYRAFATGTTASLPALPIQFADYARWERAWTAGPGAAADLAYWKSQLADVPPLLVLPYDRPRPPAQTFVGGQIRVELPAALVAKLADLGRRAHATIFMTLLAAFYTLLHRYSGETDLAVGTAVANRDRPETERLIGMVVNNLVLRADLAGDPSFLELLGRVRQVALDGYAHQRLPFNAVVEAVQPPRDIRFNPLYQVMFNFHDAPPPLLQLPDLDIELRQALGNGSAKFDWNIIALPYPEKATRDAGREHDLTLIWEYNADLFDEATVVRAAGHYKVALESIVGDPAQRISEVALLTDTDRARLFAEWNSAHTGPSPADTVHRMFEAQAERTPDALAVRCGTRTLTYRALNRRANRLAHQLRASGVRPEVTVGVCVERTPEMLVALLGILKAGGAYVPLDPRYPTERLAFIMSDAAVRMAVTEQRFVAELPAHGPVICLDAEPASRADGPDDNPSSDTAPGNLAYVLYTSGSTGHPKGVAVPHANVANLLAWAHGAMPKDSLAAVLGSTSIAFDISVFELFAPLTCGGMVVLVENALEWAERPGDSVTLVNTVPSVLAEFLRHQPLPASVRTVNLAGEALPAALVGRLAASAEPPEIINLYGPTETTVYSTWTPVTPDASGRPPAIGRAVANTSLYVLDPHLNPVPVGVPGELFIGGAGLARGYLGRPDLTADRFIPDPFSTTPGCRLYRTGDLVRYRADGQLEYLGRRDHQVKIRGVRIELSEIETALVQCPGVRDAIVVVQEELTGEKRLIGYLTSTAGATPGRADIQGRLRTKLPDAMVPSDFVILETLPLTPNGKVDRRALPAPPRPVVETADRISEPRTSVEADLADMWARLLELPSVGLHDNLFDLGCHSLLATQLVVEMRKKFDVALPLRQLFATPTVNGLARFIEEELTVRACT